MQSVLTARNQNALARRPTTTMCSVHEQTVDAETKENCVKRGKGEARAERDTLHDPAVFRADPFGAEVQAGGEAHSATRF